MKSKDVAELYEQVPLGAIVQIVPDRLPKLEKAKPRQETSRGVVAANAAPEPPPQISATTLATPPSGAPSVDQMRMAGSLAGAGQEPKVAADKTLEQVHPAGCRL